MASPARPKPPKNTNCGFRDKDTSSTCEDNPEVQKTPSTAPAPAVDDTKTSGSVHSTTNKDAKQENKGTETNERESLPTADQDGERMGFDFKGDSPPETGDLNINHSERANTKFLSFTEDFEEHNTHHEEVYEPSAVMENGIATNCKANIEGPGVSCKVGT